MRFARLGLRDRLSVLRLHDFRLLFAARGASEVGDRVVPVALAFAVLSIDRSPSALGFVLTARSVPVVAFLLVGGVWADRLPRQRIMFASDAVRCVVQATAAALLIGGQAHVWHLVVLQAIYGTAEAFFEPAATGLVPQTVPHARLQEANALMGLARSGAHVLGPAFAGLLVATIGSGPAIAVDAASFAVSAACLMRIAVPPQTAETVASTFLRDLATGWDEFRARTWLWVSVIEFSVFNLVGLAPFFVLGPLVAKESLGGAASWALVLSFGGIGSLVGGALALRIKVRRPQLVGFGLLPTFALVLALLAMRAPAIAVAAATLAAQAVLSYAGSLWFTVLQSKIPRDSLSRVSSFDWLGSLVCMPLGLALAGPMAGALGVSTTLWVDAALVAGSLLAVLSVASVRNLELPERPVVDNVEPVSELAATGAEPPLG